MLSLIIPCFNEEDNLRKLLEKIKFLVESNNKDLEILIVENGSNDNSYKILKSSKLYLNNKINIIKIDKNIGYGDGIVQGIKASSGNFICWCHADLQTDPVDVIEIFKMYKTKLLEENCIIKGKRINRSFLDSIFTSGMSLLTFLMFKIRLNDINAQPKIFKRNFFSLLTDSPKDFSFDIFFLLMAKKNNLKIYEHPVMWNKRFAGTAKGGGSLKLKFKLTLRTLKFMSKLKKNL